MAPTRRAVVTRCQFRKNPGRFPHVLCMEPSPSLPQRPAARLPVDLCPNRGIVPEMTAADVTGPRAASVRLVLDVPAREAEDEWVLTEENMPESTLHRDTVDLLRLILLAFVARTGRQALVAANFACRWDAAHPRAGVDPDIALVEPAPPGLASRPKPPSRPSARALKTCVRRTACRSTAPGRSTSSPSTQPGSKHCAYASSATAPGPVDLLAIVVS